MTETVDVFYQEMNYVTLLIFLAANRCMFPFIACLLYFLIVSCIFFIILYYVYDFIIKFKFSAIYCLSAGLMTVLSHHCLTMTRHSD